MRYKNVSASFFRCHNSCVWRTDRRTDGQKGLAIPYFAWHPIER